MFASMSKLKVLLCTGLLMARLSVSRVLSRLVIYLGLGLPIGSSGFYDESLAGYFEL